MKQKQQSNSGHRNFSLYCKRNLSHAKKMIPIYKNLENCEKRHKKKPLSKKKKKPHTCNLTNFFSVLYLYRALPILLYTYTTVVQKQVFAQVIMLSITSFFIHISIFLYKRTTRLALIFTSNAQNNPQPTPLGHPGPPPQDPKVAPLMKKKKCAQLLCSR